MSLTTNNNNGQEAQMEYNVVFSPSMGFWSSDCGWVNAPMFASAMHKKTIVQLGFKKTRDTRLVSLSVCKQLTPVELRKYLWLSRNATKGLTRWFADNDVKDVNQMNACSMVKLLKKLPNISPWDVVTYNNCALTTLVPKRESQPYEQIHRVSPTAIFK
jgi:hypothetical protein